MSISPDESALEPKFPGRPFCWDEDGETKLDYCNDCGVLIESWRELCNRCEQYYEGES